MSNSTITSTTYSSTTSDQSTSSSSSSSFSASDSSSLSSAASSTTTVSPSTTSVFTSVVSASSQAGSTNVITSVVTASATKNGQTDTNPVTVIITQSASSASTTLIAGGNTGTSSSSASSSSSATALQNGSGGNGSSSSSGLSSSAKVAIAVVIPVVVIALLVLGGILFWRKRKQRREQQEQRAKEIADYGYNPNNDPTLPTVAADGTAMTEDHSTGYRGWGGAAGSNRKASTTLSAGVSQGPLSDSGNSYTHSPGSPGAGGSDGHSGDPLVKRPDTMGSDELGALGAAPVTSSNQPIRRGPSNASSAYSNAARSDHSDEPPPLPNSYDQGGGFGYTQHGPYGDGTYGGTQNNDGMPIVRDVSARRNTRIQQAGQYQQGNSGIAQNF